MKILLLCGIAVVFTFQMSNPLTFGIFMYSILLTFIVVIFFKDEIKTGLTKFIPLIIKFNKDNGFIKLLGELNKFLKEEINKKNPLEDLKNTHNLKYEKKFEYSNDYNYNYSIVFNDFKIKINTDVSDCIYFDVNNYNVFSNKDKFLNYIYYRIMLFQTRKYLYNIMFEKQEIIKEEKLLKEKNSLFNELNSAIPN